MNLPVNPGRARRLAYSNYIRNNFYRDRNINNIDVRIVGRRVERQNVEIISKDLSIKDLINKSNVYFTKDLFSCSICLSENNDICIIRKLSCSHNFHINCIEKWLSNNPTCPICRFTLV